MKHDEFHIGLEFWMSGAHWRCTDVGTRTILAIRLNAPDASWYNGPPYAVAECVIDEDALAACSLQPPDEVDDERMQPSVSEMTPEVAARVTSGLAGAKKGRGKRRYPLCPDHPDALPVRHERHDAYFCIACDRWLEKRCGDAQCEFCSRRPERPSVVRHEG